MRAFLLLSLLLPGIASAERFDVLGSVELVVAHNAAVFGADGDYLTLSDVESLGTCLSAPSPRGQTRVYFRLPNSMQRAFDLALYAYSSRTIVKVSVDDTIVDASGACILRWITVDRRGRLEKDESADDIMSEKETGAPR